MVNLTSEGSLFLVMAIFLCRFFPCPGYVIIKDSEKRVDGSGEAERRTIRMARLCHNRTSRNRLEGEVMKDSGQNSAGSGLLKGAAVLGAAAVISKLLGTLQKIPLQNLGGDTAFGIYNIVYPVYNLILTLAIAGFPLAISKFVSERIAEGREGEARHVLNVASALLMISGVLSFALLYFGAGPIARLLGSSQTESAIRSVSFALLLVPPLAALRGYFQGRGNMVPTAASQVMEQLVRVVTMIALLLYFLRIQGSNESIAAGATFGSVTGAAAGLAAMAFFWTRDLRKRRASSTDPRREPTGRIVRSILRVALPIGFGSVALPVLTLVDSFTMPRLLGLQGLGETARLHQIGLYNHGQPLVQLVNMIVISMSAALVPAISEANMKGQRSLIHSTTDLSVRFTWLVGLAASFGLAFTAVPLNIMFFKSAEGWEAMAILAFTAAFGAVSTVTGSVLIGLGSASIPAWNLLIAALIKTLLNLWLIPLFGIEGSAVSAVCAYAAAAALNLLYLRRGTGFRLSAGSLLFRPAAAVICMCFSIVAFRFLMDRLFGVISLSIRLQATVTALVCVAVGAAVFTAALFRFGAVTRRELERIPGVGEKVVSGLVRLKWIKS